MRADGVLYKRRSHSYKNMIISIAIFAVVLVLFIIALAVTNSSSSEYEVEVLESAINESILSCYVTEGRYPESFEYLKNKYGITYDENRYRVDYVIYGSNMRPDVTIIALGEK